jgi:uncharacterized phage protein (TIGR01671 family)
MKREILFRGKSAMTGEWIYGNLVLNTYKEKVDDHIGKDYVGASIVPVEIEKGIEPVFCLVFLETVGQYTELKDINGVKIFEGDIVNEFRTGEPVCVDVRKNKKLISFVEWDTYNPCMVLVRQNSKYSDDLEYDFVKCSTLTLEVIGNIHKK